MRRQDLRPAVLAEQVDELVGRLDRVGADAQRAGEHVGRSAGHHPDGGRVGAREPAALAQHAVDHLVHRAVAAVHDQHVDAVAGGLAGDLDGVAAVVGVRDGQLDPALQRVGEQVATGARGRRRVGVDDQHGAHEPRAYRGVVHDAGQSSVEYHSYTPSSRVRRSISPCHRR